MTRSMPLLCILSTIDTQPRHPDRPTMPIPTFHRRRREVREGQLAPDDRPHGEPTIGQNPLHMNMCIGVLLRHLGIILCLFWRYSHQNTHAVGSIFIFPPLHLPPRILFPSPCCSASLPPFPPFSWPPPSSFFQPAVHHQQQQQNHHYDRAWCASMQPEWMQDDSHSLLTSS